ncbi:MAG: cyclodeaminase [Thermaerobacter sp.]|nr:cyclodeaminase [Thermaerobacter sp.]
MLVATEQEIRAVTRVGPETILAVEDGFNLMAAGKVQTPPIMRIDVPEHNGEVDVKAAQVAGREFFAIKISSGFFDNDKLGLPSGSGLMVLLSAQTGQPAALLLDNGYLTDVRTAAAGAIAAKYLARASAQIVGMIGSGTQARFQLDALRHVRPVRQVLVYSRNPENARRFADEMSQRLGIPVTARERAADVVRESDLVVTSTPATKPIVEAAWLHPGLHITALGADAEYKQELAADVVRGADRVFCDLVSQCRRLGELHHALEAGALTSVDRAVELGQVTSQQRLGRTRDDQVTVCDLTGTGVQDTMIAAYTYAALVRAGLGTSS